MSIFQLIVWALLAYGIHMALFDAAKWAGFVSSADLHSWWFGLVTFFPAFYGSAWMLANLEEHNDPFKNFRLTVGAIRTIAKIKREHPEYFDKQPLSPQYQVKKAGHNG